MSIQRFFQTFNFFLVLLYLHLLFVDLLDLILDLLFKPLYLFSKFLVLRLFLNSFLFELASQNFLLFYHFSS